MSDPVDPGLSSTGNSKDVPLWVRIVCGVAAGAVTPIVLTKASLAGVDFETLGISSELVKGGISGALTGVAVAPVECCVAVIISVRVTWRTLRDALTSPLPPEKKE